MRRLSCLVVDDDPNARTMLAAVLRSLKCEAVSSVSNGREAVIKCEEVRPDIVWMDIDMPGIDGLEVLRMLKENMPEILVVMVSGHGTVGHVKRALSMGVNGFIVKPFTTRKIQDVLEKFRSEGREAS